MSPYELRYKARRAFRPMRQTKTDRVCRVLNVIVAVIGIVVTLPLMILIALAIKLTSRGPVIFKQQRIGVDRRRDRGPTDITHRRERDLGGELFTIYKFRTMREHPATGEVWAKRDDPRVTAVGRLLRATRLDELPQFVNVLKGDMNIVGPRPEQPQIFQDLRSEFGAGYQRRQRVLPGITGLAQVQLGYDEDVEGVRKKLSLDLEYISSRSPGHDLTIMAKTIPVIVNRKVWK